MLADRHYESGRFDWDGRWSWGSPTDITVAGLASVDATLELALCFHHAMDRRRVACSRPVARPGSCPAHPPRVLGVGVLAHQAGEQFDDLCLVLANKIVESNGRHPTVARSPGTQVSPPADRYRDQPDHLDRSPSWTAAAQRRRQCRCCRRRASSPTFAASTRKVRGPVRRRRRHPPPHGRAGRQGKGRANAAAVPQRFVG